MNPNQQPNIPPKSQDPNLEGQKLKRFQELYAKMRQFYANHDLDSSVPLIKQAGPLYENINLDLLGVPAEKRKEYEWFLFTYDYQMKDLIHYWNLMDKNGWEDAGEEDQIRIFTKRDEGTVAVMMEREMDIPMEIFLTVVTEMDYYSQMIKEFKESRQERLVARNHKIGYIIYDLPMISLREASFEALAYNRLWHNNTVFLFGRSINNKPEVCQRLNYKPTTHSNYVQIDYRYLSIKYVPTNVGKGHVTVALNLDMKLNFVPMMILQFVCKKFCLDFFNTILDAAKRFKGSVWQAKIKKNPETYNYFISIMEEYYKRKQFK